jgi:hypothetical protein
MSSRIPSFVPPINHGDGLDAERAGRAAERMCGFCKPRPTRERVDGGGVVGMRGVCRRSVSPKLVSYPSYQ